MGTASPPSCSPKAIPSLTLAMSWEGVMEEAALCCGDSVGASVTWLLHLGLLGAWVPTATWVPILSYSTTPCHSCPHAVLQPFPPWWGAGHTQMKPVLSMAVGCACDTHACSCRSCRWQ